MTGSTPILGLTLPGGGAQNKYGPADPVDIDKINDNFTKIDSSVGIPLVPDASLPTNPYLWQTVHATTTDGIVTWNGSLWQNFFPSRLQAGVMATTYYTRTQFGGAVGAGALDGRYFTETELLNNGALDSVYAKKGDGSGLHIAGLWSNTYTMAAGGGSRTHITANFPAGRFTAAPNVSVTPNSQTPDNVFVSYNNVTATSADIYLSRSDGSVGSPITTSVSVLAIQTN